MIVSIDYVLSQYVCYRSDAEGRCDGIGTARLLVEKVAVDLADRVKFLGGQLAALRYHRGLESGQRSSQKTTYYTSAGWTSD